MKVNYLHISYKRIFLLTVIILLGYKGNTQDSTNLFKVKKRKGLIGKLVQNFVVNRPLNKVNTLSIKNTSPFINYKGLNVRYINVVKISYGNSILDTSKGRTSILDNITKALHSETRKQTILQNLFFTEGDTLRPFLLADNERFLRTLPFIQDARIVVHAVDYLGDEDSVDITIIYKEAFQIGFNITSGGTNQLYTEIRDENIRGSGDKLLIQNYTDISRMPHAGWGVAYTRSNIKGSFLNLSAGVNNLTNSINNGSRQELNYYTTLNLPLVSPYRCLTGSLTASVHKNNNYYVSDSLYKSSLNYNYKQMDFWVGYNLSNRSIVKETNKRITRYLVAFRTNYIDFENKPLMYSNKYNYLYANTLDLLISGIAFKQESYRTSYIYGFGMDEDIPEGKNFTITGGWTNKYGIERWYIGADLQRTFLSNNGYYYNLQLKAGSYLDNGKAEDANLLCSVDIFSKLYQLGKSHWLLRHFISTSLTKQYHAILNQPLLLNSSYGLPPLVNPDSFCNTRFTINLQSIFFNTYSLAGFRFAPFSFGSLSYVRTTGESFHIGDGYTAIGVGVRSRNENLIFGTMELKLTYIPRVTFNTNQWNISFNTDLAFRYSSQYIKKHDFISVN